MFNGEFHLPDQLKINKTEQMKKFYYLSTCSTCTRIMKELQLPKTVELQDIKTHPVSESDLKKMVKLTGKYELLFNKRSQLYKERKLKEQTLSEQDYKALILEHYTFLKRPVLVLENRIFVGNEKKTVEAAKQVLLKI